MIEKIIHIGLFFKSFQHLYRSNYSTQEKFRWLFSKQKNAVESSKNHNHLPRTMLVLRKLNYVSNQVSKLKVWEAVVPEIFQ